MTNEGAANMALEKGAGANRPGRGAGRGGGRAGRRGERGREGVYLPHRHLPAAEPKPNTRVSPPTPALWMHVKDGRGAGSGEHVTKDVEEDVLGAAKDGCSMAGSLRRHMAISIGASKLSSSCSPPSKYSPKSSSPSQGLLSPQTKLLDRPCLSVLPVFWTSRRAVREKKKKNNA